MEKSDINSKLDRNILELLWKLANKNSNSRIDTTAEILNILQEKQDELNGKEATKDLTYTVERLVKGLASSRGAARLGFCLLLTEILKQMVAVDIEDVLELVKQHITNNAIYDKSDIVFAELFAYSAIIRSGKLPNHSHLSFIVIQIHNLVQGKDYILNACYELFVDLFSQLSQEQFQTSVWPQLQPKLSMEFRTSSANTIWPLLLCLRMFPEVVTKKYLKKNWKTEDLFSDDNFEHHKKIITLTTSCLPMLHPFCLELVAYFKGRKNLKDIWNPLIDANLFKADSPEKAYVGFEMVKKMLEGNSKKKMIKAVLSSNFRTMFLNGFLIKKHPIHPATVALAQFFTMFVQQNSDPEVQKIILNVFLQSSESLFYSQVFQHKEVSTIVQNLHPDAVKSLFELLKSIAFHDINSDDKGSISLTKHDRTQAVVQIGSLVSHSVMNSDTEWKLSIEKFLFLHSFFQVKKPIDILHCEEQLSEEISVMLKESFSDMFFKAIGSLHHRGPDHTAPQERAMQHLNILTEYADQIMEASECIAPHFSLDEIQESWHQMKSIVHKLSKQSKKDGKTDESYAFQVLFLELGFHLFRDPKRISKLLEELHICCKKALHARKNVGDDTRSENEPTWIGVVVDILLSLLSENSSHLRSIVTSVFPMFCSFINEDALQQILDVITPVKAEDNAMLVDEMDEEGSDVEFESGSSSDESDAIEQDIPKVDEEFRKKIKEALGAAAEISDAESVLLSDSEMFKLDDTLAEAFKSRVQAGHTQLNDEDKAMLNFRTRCLDLVVEFLKSDPPMYLVIQCIQPLLSAYEYGYKGKQQKNLLQKTLTTLNIFKRIKKFQHQDKVDKSAIKTLLESLMAKCHKEKDITVAKKLYSVCVFLVLCLRRLEAAKHSGKETKKSSYLKIYYKALEEFVKRSSSHVYPQLFTSVMEACPDLAWSFVLPCQEYAFGDTRLFKKTQCFSLISEALKYSKEQSSVASDAWLEMGSNFICKSIETLQNMPADKPTHVSEMLNVMHSFYSIVKEKTGQSLFEEKKDLLSILMDMETTKVKLTPHGNSAKRNIIMALGGNMESESEKKLKKKSDPKRVLDIAEDSNAKTSQDIPQDIETHNHKKQKKSKRNSSISELISKKMKVDSLSNGVDECYSVPLMNGTEVGAIEDSTVIESSGNKKSKSKKKKRKSVEVEED